MSTLDFDEVRETANTSINTNMKMNINADTNTIGLSDLDQIS